MFAIIPLSIKRLLNRYTEDTIMKKTYKIEVDCANCAGKMEVATRKTPGVASATVNYMTQKMTVEFEEGADIAATMAAGLKSCKKVESDCEIFL